MMDELEQIDLSPIADLVRIKGEEEVLRDRLAQMDGGRRRYRSSSIGGSGRTTRRARVRSRPSPAPEGKGPARICEVPDPPRKSESAAKEAALEKEELEFRRDLGEFPDDQFRERLSAAEQRIAERKRDLDAVAEMRAKFVAAFHSEEDLSAPAPPVPSAPSVPPIPTPPTDATVFLPEAGPPSGASFLSEEDLSLVKPRLVAVRTTSRRTSTS